MNSQEHKDVINSDDIVTLEIEYIVQGSMSTKIKKVPIKVIDNTKLPYTVQPDGKSIVYLLVDMIKEMELLIKEHGPKVGITCHHCGMGQYAEEIVVLKERKNE